MKFTEGAFKEWGYQVAQEFGAELLDRWWSMDDIKKSKNRQRNHY